MPLPVIADTMRVAIEGKLANGHNWANILHFRKASGVSFATAIAVLDPALVSHLQTAVGGGQTWKNSATTAASVQAIRYTPLDGASATVVNTHIIAGASAGEALPGNTALVITLRTASRGRSFRGRVYQAPFNETQNAATGVPVSAEVAGVAAQWNGLLTNLVATGVSLVVASYKLALATNVATCTVDGRWDTQRRRLNT